MELERRRPPSAHATELHGRHDSSHVLTTDATPQPVLTSIVALPRQRGRPFWLAFTGLNVIVLIISMDATALSTALAVISHDLDGSTFASFWAATAFLLANVVSMPAYLALVDSLGRTIPLYLAFAFFVVGSIVFAIAPTMPVLVVSRFLQGLGAGGLDVIPEIIVSDITDLKERPLYVGLLGLPQAAGSVLGPVMSAFLAQSSNWRWIGWIDLPLSAIAGSLILALRTPHIPFTLMKSRAKRTDWIGMSLSAVGCSAIILPLSWAGPLFAWGSWRTLVTLIIGVTVLVFLIFFEQRASAPIFPRRLFRPPTAIAALVAVFMHGLVVYSLLLYMPLFFQAVHLQTPIETVVSLLPVNLSVVAFGCIAGFLVERLGKYTWIVRGGAVVMSIGMGLLSLLGHSTPLAVQTVYELLAGAGTGTLYTILTIPMQASVICIEDVGLAAGTVPFARLLGGSTGLAISSAAFSHSFSIPTSLIGHGGVASALADGNAAINFITALRTTQIPANVLTELIASYHSAFQVVWYTLAACSVAGSLATLWIKDFPLTPAGPP